MSLRRAELALCDLVDAARQIASFLDGVDKERFLDDSMIRSAVYGQLVIIGEAARTVPDDLRHRHAEVPWHRMVGLRNQVVHRYFSVDWDVVWSVARDNVPEMSRQVLDILREEYPLAAQALDEGRPGPGDPG